MSGLALRLKSVSLAYHKTTVVTQVSLEVSPGEVVGLVGPNGSGKSTLLRAISGVLTPFEGSVWLNGKEIRQLSRAQIARQLAVVPQDPHLPESFTAAEVVLMGRNPHLGLLRSEGSRDLAIARWAMETTATWHLAQRPMGELSGGELRRVIIARALAQEPQVLLLDEPTAHLDIYHQTAIMDLIRRLASQRQMPILAAIHDLTLAAQYCHRLYLLKDGCLWASGTPQEVLTAENIAAVWGVEVCVVEHPQLGTPAVLTLPTFNSPAQ